MPRGLPTVRLPTVSLPTSSAIPGMYKTAGPPRKAAAVDPLDAALNQGVEDTYRLYNGLVASAAERAGWPAADAGSGQMNSPDFDKSVQAFMELHKHAKGVGEETGAGFPVPHFLSRYAQQDGSHQVAGPAHIRQTTLDAEVKKYYGDAYRQVRRSAVAGDASSPQDVFGHKAGSLKDQLVAPMHGITQPYARGTYYRTANTYQRPSSGGSFPGGPLAIKQHELGHATGGEIPGPTGLRPQDFTPERMADTQKHYAARLLEQYPQLAGFPEGLRQMAYSLAYSSQPNERWANLANLKRLNYAVTGEMLGTKGDRIRAVMEWMNSKPGNLGTPSNQFFEMFPTTRKFRYGPKAGGKAENYDHLRERMRFILETMSPDEIKDAIETLGRVVSRDKPTGIANA